MFIYYSSRRLLLLAVVLALALAGALAILTAARAMSDGINAVKVGLVTDQPSFSANNFLEMSYEGLVEAQNELGVVGSVYTATDPAQIDALMQQCAADGNMLCISVGFSTADAISNTAKTSIGTKFAIMDHSFTDYPGNLQGVMFASEEAAYLAGTLAGKMTVSDVLGVIGGMPIPTVDSFIDGYAQGAHCANPEVTTIITYTNSFWDPARGAQFAQELIGMGADVIFAPAGADGAGAILTATQSGAWAIGVDSDQYIDTFDSGAVDGAELLLTSAMKRLDNAVFQVISETVSGSFISGTMIYDLSMGGVDLAPYHEADAAIPADVKAAVDAARAGLIAGTIDPYGPCPVNANRFGLVADGPNLVDGGFNQLSYEGLLQAQDQLGVEGIVYTSTDQADIQANLDQCAADGSALCIMVGWTGSEAISNSAKTYPGTMFAILDVAFNQYPGNLQGIQFASEEAAYLAGTLAGKMTASDILGIIGGMQIQPVDVFIDGYTQGAYCANLDVSSIISYTNDFGDPALGAQFAQSMLAQGADVIFAPAGPTGNGAIITATQSGAWAVGVDVDQYLNVFESGALPGADLLLTSAMKRLDNAVFQVISETLSSAFISGTVTYDLAKGGVDLAPYHEADAAIPANVKAAVEAARAGLIAGKIDPYGPCPGYIYLPLSNKSYQP